MNPKHTDPTFILLKSLSKSEKRNFKLFVTRNSASENLKTILLFDTLDKMEHYNERLLLQKEKRITKAQLSNLKANLYKQILSSLRILKQAEDVEMHMHELMDFSRILFNKGLYIQCLKQIEKIKEQAEQTEQWSYLYQALMFEKKIESLYITRSMQEKAETLSKEIIRAEDTLKLTNAYSNLALQLYSWYLQYGHAKSNQDIKKVHLFFQSNLPKEIQTPKNFYQKIYYHQACCWRAFIQLDFINFYRHTQSWFNCFLNQPKMIAVETASYIKAFHNLSSALFYIIEAEKLSKLINQFELFFKTDLLTQNENNKILAYQYFFTARINLYFLQGRFESGLKLVPFLEKMLAEYEIYLDRHRVLIFYYKIACLYFGSGRYEESIEFLNRIINQKANLRNDIQCYARLLHLIAHYEIGNFNLLEYLSKSVYRFLSKMETLSLVEIEILKFLQKAIKIGSEALVVQFEKLHHRLKKLEHNPLESRAFAYLDIISWLESKIQGVEVQKIIRKKYLEHKTRKN